MAEETESNPRKPKKPTPKPEDQDTGGPAVDPSKRDEGDGDKPKFTYKPTLQKFWHHFRILRPGLAILHGTYAMDHAKFKPRSRGLQGAPCSVVAIIFGSLFPLKEWTRDYVNRILDQGDDLFRVSQSRNQVPSNQNLTTSLIYREFYLGDYKCRINASDSGISGYLFSESVGCPDFMQGLDRYLETNTSGVITAQGASVGIWKDPELGFLYFDPLPCDEIGRRSSQGAACVVRFKCANDLKDTFLSNLNRDFDSKYCIGTVKILEVRPVRRDPVAFQLPTKSEGLAIDKRLLRTLNAEELEEARADCARKVPREQRGPGVPKLHKRQLSIVISNYSIDRKFATEPLVDQSTFDTGYPYHDLHVNVPSMFKELPGDWAILHGWTHEGSEAYRNKGAQNVTNCAMALAMRTVHDVRTWLRPKLDEILALGDALCNVVRADKPSLRKITASDLDDVVFEVEGRQLVLDVDVITVTGTLISKTADVLSLKRAVERFFASNTDGIVECSSGAVAVWSQNDFYYTFDPKQCGVDGTRVVEDGTRGGKKGKDVTEKKSVKGKCCVVRVPDLDGLASLYLKNVDRSKKNDRFTIRRVTVMDDVPGIRAWNAFQPAEAGKTWILRGGIANDDENLGEDSQGVQGMAIPVVGVVAAVETPPSKWTKEVLDAVIVEGDAYYNWCVSPDDEDRSVPLNRLKRRLYVKNRRVSIEIEESSVESDTRDELEKGLHQFFEKHQFGVLETGDLAVTLWKFEEKSKDKSVTAFYALDPNPRGPSGHGELDDAPVACVLRALNPSIIAEVIGRNAGPETSGEFSIHSVKVTSLSEPMTDEEVSRDKEVPVKPDLNFYAAIGEDGACLSGAFNQAHEGAFKSPTRDKQQAANSLVALGMTQLYDPTLWTPEVVNDILKLGDKLTLENLENLPEVEEDAEDSRDYLLPGEVQEDFAIGVNRISVSLEEESASGKVSDLAKVLEEYLKEAEMGILRQEKVVVPFWKGNEVYFAMDPKGRDPAGAPDDNAPAGVLWFTNVPSLAASVQARMARDGNFVMDGVTLENVYEPGESTVRKTESTEELWHHFPKEADGIWAIDGTVSMEDERFEESNRNQQSASIAVMAVVFSKAYLPKQWSAQILDEVVVTGDKLHSKCVERLGEGSAPKVTEILPEFFLSTRRIDLDIRDCVQAGDLGGKPPKLQDLQAGVDAFFGECASGVLTIKGRANVALWKAGDFYYCVVPSLETTSEGTSMPRIARFASTRLLVDYLLSRSGTEGDYEIAGINVVDWNRLPPWKFDPSLAVRPANLPPLNAFRRLPAARAILRASAHQASEMFPAALRNRQTPANCVVAIGMSLIKSPVTWTKRTLDEILAIGSNVYRESAKGHPAKVKLRPVDVIRVFYVGVNVLTSDVEEGTVVGQVSLPPVDPEDKGGKGKARGRKGAKAAKRGKRDKSAQRERTPPPPPVYLEEGLKLFFERNSAGVLVTGRFMVSVWKEMGVYFVYDPRARNDQGLADPRGTSCVMWFACLEPMLDLILGNIDEEERYGNYSLCRVVVNATIVEPLPCPVGFRTFVECEEHPKAPKGRLTTLDVQVARSYERVEDREGLWILRGGFHSGDVRFGSHTRGMQSTAVAAVAIVVGCVYAPSTWSPDLVDFVLVCGNSLHVDSCRHRRCGPRTLSPRELLRTFIVGDCRAHLAVHCDTMAGVLLDRDLRESLNLFFADNSLCILHTNNLAVAVMRRSGKFYLFDGSPLNERGERCVDGRACVLESEDPGKLVDVLIRNCRFERATVYTLNAVDVLSLHFFPDAKNKCPPKCEQIAPPKSAMC